MRESRRSRRVVLFNTLLIMIVFELTMLSNASSKTLREKSGPIPIVNQSPIQVLFLQPTPDRAKTLDKGKGLMRLNTTLTNTLVSKQSSNWDATMDMEALMVSLDMSYGISPRLEVGCSLPVSYHWPGILDGFIYNVEKLFGGVRDIREAEERYSYTYHVEKDGETIISGSNYTLGINDIPLRLKANIFEQSRNWPALSVRASFKLPTGSKSKAFGSGEFDWALGLLLEKDIKNLSLYFNGDMTSPGQPYEDHGISLEEFYTLMFGSEYGFTPKFSLLGQFYYISRPFANTGVDPLDRRIKQFLLGAGYRTQNNLLIQGGIVEDILNSEDAGADVTFFLNIVMGF